MTRQSTRESTDSPKAMMLIDHLYNFISVFQTCRLFPAIKWLCARTPTYQCCLVTDIISLSSSKFSVLKNNFYGKRWTEDFLRSIETIFKEDSALAHAKFTFTRLWPAPLSYDKKSRVALSFSRHQQNLHDWVISFSLRRTEPTFIHIPTDSSLRRRHFAIYLNIFLVAFLVFSLVGDCREIFQLIYFSNGSCC